MTEILRQKLLKLVRGDDGVALVVTLALFMFLYVSCAGVYTVGRAVRDRIVLQNAVDAAAYSAAVVQADYLSRIATINKAMAWNYVQFIKSQKNWVSLSFLDAVYKETWALNTPIEIIAGEKRMPVTKELLSSLIVGKSLESYEREIEEYYSRLSYQQGKLNELWAEMSDEKTNPMRSAAENVLKANLPWRLGELCRFKVNVKDVLQPMGGETDENRFVDISRQDTGSNPTWYEFSGSDGFSRDVLGTGKLVASPWQRSNDGINWDPVPGVDAVLRKINRLVPHYGFEIQPLKLVDGQFFQKDSDAKGAITVAVAKWNENPWTGLVRDLTGIHAAFDYGEKNDWTFAIASAQAGYRTGGDDANYEAREYSLNGAEFDFITFGMKKSADKDTEKADEFIGHDWDAVHIPVRMAFTKEGFASWMKEDSKWGLLVPTSEREYVDYPLQTIRFYELNHEALARMHSSGGAERVLEWNTDSVKDFLDLMYH